MSYVYENDLVVLPQNQIQALEKQSYGDDAVAANTAQSTALTPAKPVDWQKILIIVGVCIAICWALSKLGKAKKNPPTKKRKKRKKTAQPMLIDPSLPLLPQVAAQQETEAKKHPYAIVTPEGKESFVGMYKTDSSARSAVTRRFPSDWLSLCMGPYRMKAV